MEQSVKTLQLDSTSHMPPKPRMTLRGVLIACFLWLLYALMSAIPLISGVGLPFMWAFTGQLISAAILAVCSLPEWYIVIRKMHDASWWYKIFSHTILGPFYAVATTWLHITYVNWVSQGAAVQELETARQWMVLTNFTLYVLQFTIFHWVETMRKLRWREKQALELLALNKERELETLKSQINPHFLFNTLNSISAMASRDPEETRAMLAQLGDLLRYAIDMSKKNVVLLRDELEFVKAYLALESKRLGDRMQVELNIDAKALDCRIPPMVLQPLVENAIKHGIEPGEQGGRVVIEITQAHGTVEVRVEDTGAGFAGASLSQGGNGIGLQNTDARLRKMYGDGSALWTEAVQPSGFEVGFSIPQQQ